MNINFSSIESKIQKYANAPKFTESQKVKQVVDKKILGSAQSGNYGVKNSPEEAAGEFIRVLEYEMEGDRFDLGPTAKSAILSMYYNEPYPSNIKGCYCVDLYFGGDLERESLNPERYPDGIDNIVALLNKGYNAKGSVHGEWHGNDIWSKAKRSPARFLEQTISDFCGNYGSDYGVVNVELDRVYK